MSFYYTNTNGAVPLGKAPKQQPRGKAGQNKNKGPNQAKRSPRPIKQKVELFRNAFRLKQDQTTARVSISSDITDDQMLAYKEVQMLHNAIEKSPT